MRLLLSVCFSTALTVFLGAAVFLWQGIVPATPLWASTSEGSEGSEGSDGADGGTETTETTETTQADTDGNENDNEDDGEAEKKKEQKSALERFVESIIARGAGGGSVTSGGMSYQVLYDGTNLQVVNLTTGGSTNINVGAGGWRSQVQSFENSGDGGGLTSVVSTPPTNPELPSTRQQFESSLNNQRPTNPELPSTRQQFEAELASRNTTRPVNNDGFITGAVTTVGGLFGNTTNTNEVKTPNVPDTTLVPTPTEAQIEQKKQEVFDASVAKAAEQYLSYLEKRTINTIPGVDVLPSTVVEPDLNSSLLSPYSLLEARPLTGEPFSPNLSTVIGSTPIAEVDITEETKVIPLNDVLQPQEVVAIGLLNTAKVSFTPPSFESTLPSSYTQPNQLQAPDDSQDLKALPPGGVTTKIYATVSGFPVLSPAELAAMGRLDLTQGGRYDRERELESLEIVMRGEMPADIRRKLNDGIPLTTAELTDMYVIQATIINRAIASGKSITETVYEDKQYSSVTHPNPASRTSFDPGIVANSKNLGAAVRALADGTFARELGLNSFAPDEVAFATHYYSPAGIAAETKGKRSTPSGWDIDTNQPYAITEGGHVVGNVLQAGGVAYDRVTVGASVPTQQPGPGGSAVPTEPQISAKDVIDQAENAVTQAKRELERVLMVRDAFQSIYGASINDPTALHKMQKQAQQEGLAAVEAAYDNLKAAEENLDKVRQTPSSKEFTLAVAARAEMKVETRAANTALEMAIGPRDSLTKESHEAALEAVSEPKQADLEVRFGPKRPNAPTSDVVDRVRESVYAVFGPGYTMVATSGMGDYGSAIRHPKGKAVDFYVKNTETGVVVSMSDPRMKELALDWARTTKGSVGAGSEYMGNAMHLDLVTPEDIGQTRSSLGVGGYSSQWGSKGKAWAGELNAARTAAADGAVTARQGFAPKDYDALDPDEKAALEAVKIDSVANPKTRAVAEQNVVEAAAAMKQGDTAAAAALAEENAKLAQQTDAQRGATRVADPRKNSGQSAFDAVRSVFGTSANSVFELDRDTTASTTVRQRVVPQRALTSYSDRELLNAVKKLQSDKAAADQKMQNTKQIYDDVVVKLDSRTARGVTGGTGDEASVLLESDLEAESFEDPVAVYSDASADLTQAAQESSALDEVLEQATELAYEEVNRRIVEEEPSFIDRALTFVGLREPLVHDVVPQTEAAMVLSDGTVIVEPTPLERAIESAFASVLGREVRPEELAYWKQMYPVGQSLEELLRQTDEYANRNTDEVRVTVVYNTDTKELQVERPDTASVLPRVALLADAQANITFSDGTFAPATYEDAEGVNYQYDVIRIRNNGTVESTGWGDASFATYQDAYVAAVSGKEPFRLGDVKKITYYTEEIDGIPTYLVYTIALEQGPARVVYIPHDATELERRSYITDTGFVGEPNDLLAQAESTKAPGTAKSWWQALLSFFKLGEEVSTGEQYAELSRSLDLAPRQQIRPTQRDIASINLVVETPIVCPNAFARGYLLLVEPADASELVRSYGLCTEQDPTQTPQVIRQYLEQEHDYLITDEAALFEMVYISDFTTITAEGDVTVGQ